MGKEEKNSSKGGSGSREYGNKKVGDFKEKADPRIDPENEKILDIREVDEVDSE